MGRNGGTGAAGPRFRNVTAATSEAAPNTTITGFRDGQVRVQNTGDGGQLLTTTRRSDIARFDRNPGGVSDQISSRLPAGTTANARRVGNSIRVGVVTERGSRPPTRSQVQNATRNGIAAAADQ